MDSQSRHGFAIRCSLIASLGGFLFGFETAVISGAEKNIQQLWSLNSFWQGFTVSASLIGTVIGALATSVSAQKYGRKKVLLLVAIAYLLLVRAWQAPLRYYYTLSVSLPFSPFRKEQLSRYSDQKYSRIACALRELH